MRRPSKADLPPIGPVGFQSRLDVFLDKLRQATGFAVQLRAENANPERAALESVDAETRRRIRGWIELDVEVYEWALATLG